MSNNNNSNNNNNNNINGKSIGYTPVYGIKFTFNTPISIDDNKIDDTSRSSSPVGSENSQTSQITNISNCSNNILNYNYLLSRLVASEKANIELKNKIISLQTDKTSLLLQINSLKTQLSKQILDNSMAPLCSNLMQENNKLRERNNELSEQNDELKEDVRELYQNSPSNSSHEYENDSEKIEKLENKLKIERFKKRTLFEILFEFGICNETIRSFMGDFMYCAEIRRYKISRYQVTKLNNDVKIYYIGDNYGKKSFEFTNSSNLVLKISDLKIINSFNKYERIEFNIKKLDKSFGCINNNCNDYYYNSTNRNNLKPNSNISKNNDYYDCDNSDVIHPDDHFLVEFEYPIDQKIGVHSLSYRLFSYQKANAKKFKGNGAFGQKIEFKYEVQEYY